jgi:hypothetical protein
MDREDDGDTRNDHAADHSDEGPRRFAAQAAEAHAGKGDRIVTNRARCKQERHTQGLEARQIYPGMIEVDRPVGRLRQYACDDEQAGPCCCQEHQGGPSP